MSFKRLLNRSEAETDRRLREVCEDFDARVFAKVRVADVLPIEGSGLDSQLYRYALQAHFDFVVSSIENDPLFAVEFDGPGHSGARERLRDNQKNFLCDRFNLPILRVNERYMPVSYSRWDLTRWLCTVYFLAKEWDEKVISGEIPLDDSFFDPMFVSVKTRSGVRSLELESHARSRIGRLFMEGLLPCHMPNFLLAKDEAGNLRAIAWILISKDEGVLVRSSMQRQRIGEWVCFALRGIILSMLADSVNDAVKANSKLCSIENITFQVDAFSKKYSMFMGLRSAAF